jgi:hypothetical protein
VAKKQVTTKNQSNFNLTHDYKKQKKAIAQKLRQEFEAAWHEKLLVTSPNANDFKCCPKAEVPKSCYNALRRQPSSEIFVNT